MKKLINTLQYIISTQGSTGKAWQLYRRECIQNGKDGVQSLWHKHRGELNFKRWKYENNKSITIIATPHTIFIAELLSQALDKAGLLYQVKIGTDFKSFDDSFHILVCPQAFKKLPESYISFQMKQTVSDRWFGQENMQKLKKDCVSN